MRIPVPIGIDKASTASTVLDRCSLPRSSSNSAPAVQITPATPRSGNRSASGDTEDSKRGEAGLKARYLRIPGRNSRGSKHRDSLMVIADGVVEDGFLSDDDSDSESDMEDEDRIEASDEEDQGRSSASPTTTQTFPRDLFKHTASEQHSAHTTRLGQPVYQPFSTPQPIAPPAASIPSLTALRTPFLSPVMYHGAELSTPSDAQVRSGEEVVPVVGLSEDTRSRWSQLVDCLLLPLLYIISRMTAWWHNRYAHNGDLGSEDTMTGQLLRTSNPFEGFEQRLDRDTSQLPESPAQVAVMDYERDYGTFQPPEQRQKHESKTFPRRARHVPRRMASDWRGELRSA